MATVNHPKPFALHPSASSPNAERPCPHDYPVHATDTGLSPAWRIASKTLGYAWYRYVENVFLAAITLVVFSVVLGLVVSLYMYVHRYVGGVAFIGGAALLIFLVLPFIEQQSFLTHCGHIAVFTNLISRGEVGNGSRTMFAFGRSLATERLGELDTIHQVHSSMRNTTRHAVRTLDFVDRLLPIDLGFVKRAIYGVVNWASPYIDAIVLSYGIARKDSDFASAGLDALCYCLQNTKAILKTAVGALFLEKLLLAPLWLAVALSAGVGSCYAVLSLGGADLALLQAEPFAFFKAQPIVGLAALATGLVVGPLVAHIIVRTVSQAFVRPLLIAMVLVKFHVTVRHQPLDVTLRNRLVEGGEGLANLSDTAGRLSRLGV